MDDALMQAPLFSALDAEAAAALRSSMVEARISRGDAIFTEGEPGDRMYVILDGKVKLGQTSADGRESLLAVLGPGEVFGELSLFDPGPRTATATAVTDAVVIGLGHENLRPWLAGRPEVDDGDAAGNRSVLGQPESRRGKYQRQNHKRRFHGPPRPAHHRRRRKPSSLV